MELSRIIKNIGCGKNHAKNMDYDTAVTLYEAILDGKVPDIELGCILIALRIKGESQEEILGFYHVMQKRMWKLQTVDPMPIVIPSYNGARKQSNLTPLLALLLVELGFSVLVHGISFDPTRVTTKSIFAELGIKPTDNVRKAQSQLKNCKLVFTTIDYLCLPMAKQLFIRWRMGIRNSAHMLVKLANPFAKNNVLRLVSASHYKYFIHINKFFQKMDNSAILINGTEGEVYANPKHCPVINIIQGSKPLLEVHLSKQIGFLDPMLPESKEPQDTARWIKKVLDRKVAVPDSLRLQLASCIIATKRVNSVEDAELYLKKHDI